MRKLAIAMALASTAMAAPAVARDQSWYAGIEGGVMLVEDTDFDFSYDYGGTDAGDLPDAFSIDHNVGIDLDVIAGYDFGMFRAEGELGYKRASIDDIQDNTGFGFDDLEADGSVRVWSAMANLLLDFGDDSGWSGYVGGGIGLGSVRYKIDSGLDFESSSESDSGLAWQAIAGVRHAVSDNVDLGLKYRFFTVRKLEFGDNEANLSGRFRSHSLLASLIFNFAPPPPPPPVVVAPPAPPPPATQTETVVILAEPYFVFFDWNKADLTSDATAILDNAAAAFVKSGKAQIVLSGHADRSGAASYNVALSQRRADAVRAYLVTRGVAADAIPTSALGEDSPIIPTADGVREAQNRRVEITFGPGSGM